MKCLSKHYLPVVDIKCMHNFGCHVSDGNVHLGRCRGKGLNELAAFL